MDQAEAQPATGPCHQRRDRAVNRRVSPETHPAEAAPGNAGTVTRQARSVAALGRFRDSSESSPPSTPPPALPGQPSFPVDLAVSLFGVLRPRQTGMSSHLPSRSSGSPASRPRLTLPEVLILALPARTLSQVEEPGLHPILFCWSRLGPGWGPRRVALRHRPVVPRLPWPAGWSWPGLARTGLLPFTVAAAGFGIAILTARPFDWCRRGLGPLDSSAAARQRDQRSKRRHHGPAEGRSPSWICKAAAC